MFSTDKKTTLPTAEQALPGRERKMRVSPAHVITGYTMQEPFEPGLEKAMFGLGCFWGAERKFWETPGVKSTAVGYSAGITPNPLYEEVCSGLTGHNEVVLVIFNPEQVSYQQLLQLFWESHDPTQGMRQGNDRGTQYRSGIYTYSKTQQEQAEQSKQEYNLLLKENGKSEITSEIIEAKEFFYAEDYHQQYLAKNPNGYCGLGGTGVKFSTAV